MQARVLDPVIGYSGRVSVLWIGTYWQQPNSINGRSMIDAFSLSPNPVHNSLQVQLGSGGLPGTISRPRVLDAAGNVIFSRMQQIPQSGRLQLELDFLPAGLYFL